MRVALVLLLLAGCGRLQFAATDAGGAGDASGDTAPDARPCVASGHDEDGDSFDDACDVCPQLSDDQTDTDGDGIGDACDLAATVQTRLLFDPFTQMTSAWTYAGGSFSSPDVFRLDSPSGGMGATLVDAPGRDTFELTANMLDGGTLAHGISISIGTAGTQHYYCELYDNAAGTFYLAFTSTLDEVQYDTVDSAVIAGPFDSGPLRLIMDHTPPTSTCIADWGGMRYTATGPNAVGVSPDAVGFGVFQAVVEAQSFVRLTTP